MKILIISYYYKPVENPRAFRWTALAEYFVSVGHTVDVVAHGVALFELSEGVHINRVGGSLKTLRNFLIKKRAGKEKQKINIKRKLFHIAKFIHSMTWKKIYWPDFACLWYFPAKRMLAKLLKKNEYDFLISVSHPFTDHLLGLWIKKKKPGIKWLVDIGDPFFLLNKILLNNKLYNKLNFYYEKNTSLFADSICVTNQNILNEYKKLFPKIEQKFFMIPPLFSMNINHCKCSKEFKKKTDFSLVFVGTLYKDIRPPDFLLQLFVKLILHNIGVNVSLHFFGAVNDCDDFFEKYRSYLDKSIFLHGVVSRKEVSKAMSEMDLLVNIANTTSIQFPSKLIEYAATGKPIINFSREDDDVSTLFLKEYPAALCLTNDDYEDLEDGVSKVLHFLTHLPSVDSDALKVFMVPYLIGNIGKRYLEILGEC